MRVLLQKLKHVVEEADAGLDHALAGSVKVQFDGNLRLLVLRSIFAVLMRVLYQIYHD